MNSATHEIEREEVMAYLDGELGPARASAVAAHLNHCAACAALATELRGLSRQLNQWQVEPSCSQLEERVLTAFGNQEAKLSSGGEGSPRFRFIWTNSFSPRWVWATAGGLAALALFATLRAPMAPMERATDSVVPMATPRGETLLAPTVVPGGGVLRAENQNAFRVGDGHFRLAPEGQPASKSIEGMTRPMVIRTATLALVTRDFDQARAVIERLVGQRRGHFGQLTVRGQSGSARLLEATVRVPSNQLDATLAEMKKIGRVEDESQNGDEVTQEYVDLVARLSNSRHTEQRLIEVLRTRTGKVGDVLEVEQEIARVREEIERMEAQRKTMVNQVEFATVQLRLTEDYRAGLQMAPPSAGTRLWNALVEGVRNAAQSVLSLALFLLAVAPSLLLWAALLAWPARVAWRRIAAHMAAQPANIG